MDYAVFRTIAAFSDQVEALGRQRIQVRVTGDKNAGMEHALLEQQLSHVTAGTGPESENAGMYVRPVAGLKFDELCVAFGACVQFWLQSMKYGWHPLCSIVLQGATQSLHLQT